MVQGTHVPNTPGSICLLAEAYGDKGVRKQMEDEHLICFSLQKSAPTLPSNRDFSLFAIFDGHGSHQVAQFVKTYLPVELAAHLDAFDSDADVLLDKHIRQIITQTCTKIDSRIALELPSCKDGCTAVILLIKDNHTFVASLGDSSASLCRQTGPSEFHAIPLTENHKPWVIKEKERILQLGGTIENGRVNGILEVTRSFGDISLKKFGVLCTPTFRKCTLDPHQDRFILIGCDGLWNCCSAYEIVMKAQDLIAKEERTLRIENRSKRSIDLKSVCRNLVEHVIVDKKSQDNVSALIVYRVSD